MPRLVKALDSGEVLLMDGGMFDNTGLYALIRRGVRLIVVADGTQDSANDVCKRGFDGAWHLDHEALARSFANLRSTEVILKTDFGATVTWDWQNLCKQLSSDDFLERPHAFIVRGVIENLPIDQFPAHDTVRIVYVKAAYVHDGQSLRTDDFIDAAKAADPAFANDVTGNQFFTESLVQSYAELGRSMLATGSVGADALQDALAGFCTSFDPVDKTCSELVTTPRPAAGGGAAVPPPVQAPSALPPPPAAQQSKK